MSFAILMGLCVFTEFMEVIQAKMFFRIGSGPMPQKLRSFYFRILAPIVCFRRQNRSKVTDKEEDCDPAEHETWREACVVHDRIGLVIVLLVSGFFLLFLPLRTSL